MSEDQQLHAQPQQQMMAPPPQVQVQARPRILFRKRNELGSMTDETMLEKEHSVSFSMPAVFDSSVVKLKDALDSGDFTAVGHRHLITLRRKFLFFNTHSSSMSNLLDQIRSLEALQQQPVTADGVDAVVEQLQDAYDKIIKLAFNYVTSHRKEPRTSTGKARRDMVLMIRDLATEERLRIPGSARALADEVRANPALHVTYADVIRQSKTRVMEAGKNGVQSIEAGGGGTSQLAVVTMANGKKLFIRESESLKPDTQDFSDFRMDYARAQGDAQRRAQAKVTALDIEMQDPAFDATLLAEKQAEQAEARLQAQACGNRLLVSQKLQTQYELIKHDAAMQQVFRRVLLDFAYIPTEQFTYTHLNKFSRYSALMPVLETMFQSAMQEPAYQASLAYIQTLQNRINMPLPHNPSQQVLEQQQHWIQHLAEYKKGLKKMPCAVNDIITTMHDLHVAMNQRDFARQVAKIDDGDNVSNRNVATSILARALGLRDMVAESEMVSVTIDGKTMTGVSMEGVEGQDLFQKQWEARQTNQQLRYSSGALRDLLSLQVFDLICGQIDRKGNNYISQFETDSQGCLVLRSFKAIDNDMAFGKLDYYADIVGSTTPDKYHRGQRAGYVGGLRQELPAMSDATGRMTLPALDQEFANKVLELTPEFIDFLMVGILSDGDRAALKVRLARIQDIIRRQVEEDTAIREGRTGGVPKLLGSAAEWDAFRARFETTQMDTRLTYLHHDFQPWVAQQDRI